MGGFTKVGDKMVWDGVTEERQEAVPEKSETTTLRPQWKKPNGAEWFVIGRNQAKWMPDWAGLADLEVGFDGNIPIKPNSSKTVVVDQVKLVDENGKVQYDRRGYPVMKNVTGTAYYCPSCGQVMKDKRGVPMGEKDFRNINDSSSQKRCKGMYAEEVPNPYKPSKKDGLDRMCPVHEDIEVQIVGKTYELGGKTWIIKGCNEPLYQYTSSPYRWSPAKLIHKKMSPDVRLPVN